MKEKWSSDRWYKALYRWLIASAFLLAISNILALVILPLLGITTPSFEGACIQNIISIIGIAVSVWVGILVVDRLDHKEIRNLSEQAKEIEEQQILNEQLSLRLLLDDLEANKNNPIARWISEKIKNIDATAFPYGIWIAFREEEYLYRQMQQTIGKVGEEVYNQYNNCIKSIWDTIGHYKKSGASVKAIEEILCLRETEAKFLYAYSIENNKKPVAKNVISDEEAAKEAATSFIGALKYYEKNLDKFGLDSFEVSSEKLLKKDEATKMIGDLRRGRNKPEFAYIAYIFNFIGESYSKLVQYNNNYGVSICQNKDLNSCKYLALNYCLLAVTAANAGNCRRETYCRDYGCAIERARMEELPLETAIEQYKEALKLGFNEKIYHCLASAYDKSFKKSVEFEREEGRITEITLNEEKGKDFFSKKGNEYKTLIKQYLACFPNSPNAHIFSLLYYRNQYLVDSSKVSAEEIKYHSNMLGLLLPKEKVTNENEAYADGQAILEELERLEKLEAEKKFICPYEQQRRS